MKKKELTNEERYALAAKLDQIMGADLMPDEEAAIEQAIAIICPEYAADTEAEIKEVADWLGNATEKDFKELDDWVNDNFPPRKDGTIIRFGQEKKK